MLHGLTGDINSVDIPILDTACSANIISVARALEMAFIGFAFLPGIVTVGSYTGEDLTKLPGY